jgi:hypothetical protein
MLATEHNYGVTEALLKRYATVLKPNLGMKLYLQLSVLKLESLEGCDVACLCLNPSWPGLTFGNTFLSQKQREEPND